MESHNNLNNRRHHRKARAQVHALNPPAKGDLDLKPLKPRFSPTAIFSTSTTAPADTVPAHTTTPVVVLPTTAQSQAPAPVTTSSTPVAAPAPATTSSSSTPSVALPTTATSSAPSTSIVAVPITSSLSTSAPLVTESLPTTSIIPATFVTTIPPASSTSSSSTASPSATVGSGTSTSAVVGGIAGGLVGVAGLIFLTMFLVRKWRNRGQEEMDFNADAFKRQSAILVDDEPDHGRGFNPRPPTMIERHMAGNYDSQGVPPPMPSLQQYHNVGHHNSGGYGGEYDNSPYSQGPSFSPGQVMSPPPSGFSPYSPQSAYDQGDFVRHPSTAGTVYPGPAQPGQLNRHPSNAGVLNNPYAGGADSAHYVDLDRSSVTPFQAAQYAEISRKLNTEPPTGLGAVQEGEEPVSAAIHYADGAGTSHLSIPAEQGNANPESPFADPHAQVAQLLAKHQEFQNQDEDEEQDIPEPPRAITDEAVPGSPVYSLSPPTVRSPERVLSTPPMLPAIHVGAAERTFSPTSYDFPQTPSMRPSPFASSFNNSHFAQEQAASLAVSTDAPDLATGPIAATVGKRKPTTNAQRPLSSHTIYDEADVYGGI